MNSIFHAIGRAFGEILGAFLKGITEILRFRSDQLMDMRQQIAVQSLDPERYNTPECRKVVETIKYELTHSPDTLAEFEQVLTGEITKLVFSILEHSVNPASVTTPEAAQAHTETVTRLAIDVAILIAEIDILATAFSATLVRNYVHDMALVLGAAGFLVISPLMVQTSLDTRLRPLLARQLNKEAQAQLPSAQDLVLMELREVFNPAFRDEQLQPPAGDTFNEIMEQQGFSRYWSDSYWAAHWHLPSIGDLNTMLWRRKIDSDTWKRFVRRNDFLPAMIPHLEEIIYNPYTRVDIRRAWQLGVVSDDEVVSTYQDQGYDEAHARVLLQFTKAERLVPQIRRRYSNGWINKSQVLGELQEIGLDVAKTNRLFETIVKDESKERTATERNLTRADILKGVKKGVIDEAFGRQLLQQMGYDTFEVEFIVRTYLESSTGSPETPLEFQSWVNQYRLASGEDVRAIPENVLGAERELIRLRTRLHVMRDEQAPQDELDKVEAALAEAEYRFKQLAKSAGLNPEEIP